MIKTMTREALASTLVELVEGSTGIKGVELASELALRCIADGYEIPTVAVPGVLSGLVAAGRIVEVEYEVPEIPGRAKSFYSYREGWGDVTPSVPSRGGRTPRGAETF